MNIYQVFIDLFKEMQNALNPNRTNFKSAQDNCQEKMLNVLIIYALMNAKISIQELQIRYEGNVYIKSSFFSDDIKKEFKRLLINALVWYKKGFFFKEIITQLIQYVGQDNDVNDFCKKISSIELNQLFASAEAKKFTHRLPLKKLLLTAISYYGCSGLERVAQIYKQEIALDIQKNTHNCFSTMCDLLESSIPENTKYVCIEFFLKLGIKPFLHKGNAIFSLLHDVARKGYSNIVKLLLNYKIDPCLSIKKDHRLTAFVALALSEIDEQTTIATFDALFSCSLDLKKANLEEVFLHLINQQKVKVIQYLLAERKITGDDLVQNFFSIEMTYFNQNLPINLLGYTLLSLPDKFITKDFINLFVQNGFAKKNNQNTLVLLASGNRKQEIQYLLELGLTDIWEVCSVINQSPLEFFIKHNSMREAVCTLLEAKVNTSSSMDKQGAIEYFKINDDKFYSGIFLAIILASNYKLIDYFLNLRVDNNVVIFNPNGEKNRKYNLMLCAVAKQDVKIIDIMYQHKVSINKVENFIYSPIILALLDNAKEVFDYFLAKDELNVDDPFYSDALKCSLTITQLAVYKEQFGFFTALIKKIKSVNGKIHHASIFSAAMTSGDEALMNDILSLIDFDHLADWKSLGKTLHRAIAVGDFSHHFVYSFLQSLENYAIQNNKMEEISSYLNSDLVTTALYFIFIKKGFVKKTVDANPTNFITEHANVELANIINSNEIQFQKCVVSLDNQNQSPIYGILELALKFNINLNSKTAISYTAENPTYIYWTPLFLACLNNLSFVVELLLKKGANTKYSISTYSLGFAAYFGFYEIVELLLKSQADPFLINEDGSSSKYTSLDFAVLGNSYESLKLILHFICPDKESVEQYPALIKNLMRAYKLLTSEQNDLRSLISDYLGQERIQKLNSKESYQITLQELVTKPVIEGFNPEKEELFDFFDNHKQHYVKISQKDLKKLGDNAVQFEKNMAFNQELQGLFGYRIKRVGENIYKMRPTGNLGDKRIFFYKPLNKTFHSISNGERKPISLFEARVVCKAHK